MNELFALILDQQRDDEWSNYIPNRPLEILAGLNPSGMKQARPRYFRSGRKVTRRPQRITGVVCGTDAMYKRGCRCEPCRTAHSERNKAYRAKQATGASA